MCIENKARHFKNFGKIFKLEYIKVNELEKIAINSLNKNLSFENFFFVHIIFN